MALSTSECNENEAAVATQKLHALLAEYNFDKSQLGKKDHAQNPIDVTHFTSQDRPWVHWIVGAISNLNFCESYSQKVKNNRVYYVVGTELNREYSVRMITRTLAIVKRQATLGNNQMYHYRNSAYLTSFCKAASARIHARCAEMRAATESGGMKTESGVLLPALNNLYARHQTNNQTFIANTVGVLHRKRARKVHNTNIHGHTDGMDAGNRVQLVRAMGKNTRADGTKLIR